MSKKSKAVKDKTGKDKKGKASAVAALRKKDVSTSVEEAAVPVVPQPAEVVAQGASASEKSSSDLSARQITVISKALADPTRMAVLRSIAKGGSTCSGLRDCAGVSAATLSHHMEKLEAAGLIETERNGRFVNAVFQRRTWKKYVEELKALSK